MFAISNSSGDVLVVGPVDRERHAVCRLTLVAVDLARPSALPAYAHLLVRVRDLNDNPPRLTVTTLAPPGRRWAEVCIADNMLYVYIPRSHIISYHIISEIYSAPITKRT